MIDVVTVRDVVEWVVASGIQAVVLVAGVILLAGLFVIVLNLATGIDDHIRG